VPALGSVQRRAIDLEYSPFKALDLYRVCPTAGKLDVSLDWLPGRSNVMSVMETSEEQEDGLHPSCGVAFSTRYVIFLYK
jgi:hypothetical protein